MRKLIMGLVMAGSASTTLAKDDPNLWLEDVTGKKALAWVEQQNSVTQKELEALPDFAPTRDTLLKLFNSSARIPYVEKIGTHFYNFWRDKTHVRGIWRRTSLDEFRKADPKWETLIDLDALAAQEKENWVWKGINCVHPSNDRCLITLSRGGADASVIREYDLGKQRFVENGFFLPEAKSELEWKDRDTLYVMTDFGKDSLTDSGYPRIVKEWKRGTPLAAATTLVEGKKTDVSIHAMVAQHRDFRYDVIERGVTFFTTEALLRDGDTWVKLDKPADAGIAFFADQLLLQLKSDWTINGKTWHSGSLVALPLKEFLAGKRDFSVVFEPTASSALEGFTATRDSLLLTIMDDVKGRLEERTLVNGKWLARKVDTPTFGALNANAVDADSSNDYFLTFTDFLTPTTLQLGKVGSDTRETLKTLPAFFDSTPFRIQQFFAVSKDGTRVPYFMISDKNLKADGTNPTLLYGYGGFQVSMTPFYSGGLGAGWLSRGGTYVLANIRGGGEYGPKWHQAALRHNRQNAYDDFAAVAEDLIKRKITSPRHLGAMGGSNGGLLMGVMLTQRPDLFNGIVCQVPLLDMKRFNKLLAGASWMDEYGNPDVAADWEVIRRYSPYQNIQKGKTYPRTLFVTSTRDDRVHPGHARKMFAALQANGNDMLYFENTEGGHGAAANNNQQAYRSALEYSFLFKQLR